MKLKRNKIEFKTVFEMEDLIEEIYDLYLGSIYEKVDIPATAKLLKKAGKL